MENDIATMNRRDATDKTVMDNRNRNDEMTEDRRSKVDESVEKSRLRNDEITANRREAKDGNRDMALAISSLILIVLVVGSFFIFI